MPGKSIPHFSWAEAIAFDKWVHAGIFFMEVFFLVPFLRSRKVAKPILVSAIIAIVYGGLTELGQLFLFLGRSFDHYDFIANTVGALGGAVFVRSRLAGRMIEFMYT